MAQAIVFHSGSPLIGSPMTFGIVPNFHSSNYTFHRIHLRVYAALVIPDTQDSNWPSDNNYTTFNFSTPVESTTAVLFNVATALQAVADRYKYQPTPPVQYPYVKFRLEAWDEWMTDGQDSGPRSVCYYPEKFSDGSTAANTYLYAFPGHLTDTERLQWAEDTKINRWSRRPVSTEETPEIVFTGLPFAKAEAFSVGLEYDHVLSSNPSLLITGEPRLGPLSKIYPMPMATGPYYIGYGDRTYMYLIKCPIDGCEIRFINSLGCIESVHVRRIGIKTAIQTEKYAVSRQETLTQFSRAVAIKTSDRETWEMSTLPLNDTWQQWYVHEFLQTSQAWVYMPSSDTTPFYIPCHILPDETVPLRDRTKSSSIQIQFSLQLDIAGSPVF